MKTKQAATKSRRAQRLNDRGTITARREQLGFMVRIAVPQWLLEDWREDLDSALVLLQEIQQGERNLDTSSALAGAHALVDRVMDGVKSFEEERVGERAPEGK